MTCTESEFRNVATAVIEGTREGIRTELEQWLRGFVREEIRIELASIGVEEFRARLRQHVEHLRIKVEFT